jgi:hypothetical protein
MARSGLFLFKHIWSCLPLFARNNILKIGSDFSNILYDISYGFMWIRNQSPIPREDKTVGVWESIEEKTAQWQGRQQMWYTWAKYEMHTKFLLETWKQKLLGRPNHKWENIKIDLKAAGCDAMDYTLNSGHSEVSISCEYSNKPSGSTKVGYSFTSLATTELLTEYSAICS